MRHIRKKTTVRSAEGAPPKGMMNVILLYKFVAKMNHVEAYTKQSVHMIQSGSNAS